MEKISIITLARLTNSIYVQFHSSTVMHLENLGQAALGLPQDTFDAYKAAVDAAQDYVQRNLTSLYTARLAELDERRMELVRYIVAHCRYASSSPNETARAAADDMRLLIVDTYPLTLMKDGQQHRTSLINGLLVDLEKIDEDALKALGVDKLAAELKKLNTNFMQTYLARNAEYDDRGTGQMVALRKQIDELYETIRLKLTYTANRSDEELATIADSTEREKATAQRTVALRCIGQLNQHVKIFKMRFLTRDASGATEGDGKAAPDATDGAAASGDGPTNPGSDADGGTGSKPTGPTDVTEVTKVA